ncbi:MAG: hypothetical protein COB99_01775 [Sulfurimonas sp.]|nr:MAG: hypothetical protein COB99_01775 [Sulfurimonas sp.]
MLVKIHTINGSKNIVVCKLVMLSEYESYKNRMLNSKNFLQRCYRKKALKPDEKRELVKHVVEHLLLINHYLTTREK